MKTYSVKEVQAMLPVGKSGKPPSERSIKEKARQIGVLRRVGSVSFFTLDDAVSLADHCWCEIPISAQAHILDKACDWSLHTYFVRSDNFVKIGSTEKLVRRVSELQTGNPVTLTLLGVLDGTASDESSLHERFDQYRHRGEWFNFTVPIAEYIVWKAVTPQSLRNAALDQLVGAA